MKELEVLALADDMTGALEIGAKFRAAGVPAIVSTEPMAVASAPVIVYDTETRHLSSSDAAKELTRFIGAHRPSFIYKKTDSTLRGNISAELEALARLFPEWRIGYAPAYPALGRTVKAGILYVHGIPVAETEFARDALNPVRASSVSAMLHPELACTIFDGESDRDMAEAARAILSDPDMRIAAGPAGLAETVAREMNLPRSASLPLPKVRTCLVLNGSLHHISAIQVQDAEPSGWRVLSRSRDPAADCGAVSAANAKYMAGQIEAEKPDAIFVIGGDTVFALLKELGCTALTPIAEIVPGVPLSVTDQGLYLITKAGGFGDASIFARIRAKLGHA